MASRAAQIIDHLGGISVSAPARGDDDPLNARPLIDMPDRLREGSAAAAARHRRWYERWQRRQLAARDVAAGDSWVFPDHRSLAEIADPRRAA